MEGWKTYENDELGISFSYPEEWGEVEDISDFSEIRKFSFSNMKDSVYVELGGFTDEYWKGGEKGRGGMLIDARGFIDGKILKEYGVNSWESDNYKITSSKNCAYSTAKEWYGGKVYHAICNLKSEKISGFNFGFGEKTGGKPLNITEEDFVNLIESVKLY